MKFSWIEPETLAASGIPVTAEDIQSLHAHGIRAILTLTERPLTRFHTITPDLLQQLDIGYYHVPIIDQEAPTLDQIDQIMQLIDDMHLQQRPLLFHCHAGIGRTGTVLQAYYLFKGLTLEQTREQVRIVRRQCILLSHEQQVFLKTYQARLRGEEVSVESV